MEERFVVWVVDDDAEVRDVVRTLATSAGFAAEAYADAFSFLRTFEPSRLGCLVLDARMEGMSGVELQYELARRRITIPIIVTTGFADMSVAIEAMRAGAIDVIEKPHLPERLIARLREAFALHLRARDAHAQSQEIQRRYLALTPRERQVLDLVVSGLTSRAIGLQLGLQEKTIQVYRARIKKAMNAKNAADLARLMTQISQLVGAPNRIDGNQLDPNPDVHWTPPLFGELGGRPAKTSALRAPGET